MTDAERAARAQRLHVRGNRIIAELREKAAAGGPLTVAEAFIVRVRDLTHEIGDGEKIEISRDDMALLAATAADCVLDAAATALDAEDREAGQLFPFGRGAGTTH